MSVDYQPFKAGDRVVVRPSDDPATWIFGEYIRETVAPPIHGLVWIIATGRKRPRLELTKYLSHWPPR